MTWIAPPSGDFDYQDLETVFVECHDCGETYLDEGAPCPYCSEPEEEGVPL